MTKSTSISDFWHGYHLNYCVADKYDALPTDNPININWETNLKCQLRHQPVDLKFLKIAKFYWLDFDITADPEIDEFGLETYPKLDNPLLIMAKKFRYGNFNGLVPSQRDEALYSYFGVKQDKIVVPELRQFGLLRNPMSKLGDRENVAVGRREDSVKWIKERARDIQLFLEGFVAQYGQEALTGIGLEYVDLNAGIVEFFDKLSILIDRYIKTGSLKINEAIAKILAAENPASNGWLKKPIPIDNDAQGNPVIAIAGAVIQQLFVDATTPLTQDDVDAEIANRLAKTKA